MRIPTTYNVTDVKRSFDFCLLNFDFSLGGEGFAPSKAQGHLIYSQARLTTSVTTREVRRGNPLSQGFPCDMLVRPRRTVRPLP